MIVLWIGNEEFTECTKETNNYYEKDESNTDKTSVNFYSCTKRY